MLASFCQNFTVTLKMSFHGRLVGKSALVTGGGSGIGRSVCQVFAREGASVAIVDINEEGIRETQSNLATDHGNIHFAIKADVTSSKETKQIFRTAEEKLDRKISIVVNCAGITRKVSFDEMSESQFDDVINVNLKGTFLVSQEFIASLKNSKEETIRGSLINISSLAGIKGFPNQSNYCASKFGVIGLTKTIAQEYARHRVRSNAVLPGWTETPLLSINVKESVQESIAQEIPMGRIGTPEEIANACLFLASDESSYVNGACLEVSGGYHC
uniref:3-oxoacyl-[acyl-carrier-protein] reductase FabG-like n=1 Tax=Styela clava TaxID=7725 RepID=UPI0019395BA6|nr:3-oxoacyl-[acyl-carrier-protein] reductase FabG-like [Styela clava]